MAGNKTNTKTSIKVLIAVNTILILGVIALILLIIPRLKKDDGRQSMESVQETVSDNNQTAEAEKDPDALSEADKDILETACAFLDKGLYQEGLKELKKIEKQSSLKKYYTHIDACRETRRYLITGETDAAEKKFNNGVDSTLSGAYFIENELKEVLSAESAEEKGDFDTARVIYAKLGSDYEGFIEDTYEREARFLISEDRQNEAGYILARLVNDDKYLDNHFRENFNENASQYRFNDELYNYFSTYYDDDYMRFVVLYDGPLKNPVGFYYVVGNYDYKQYPYDMEGNYLGNAPKKKSTSNPGTQKEKNFSVQNGYKEEADLLISQGKYAEAGPILLKLAGDSEYLLSKYRVSDVNEEPKEDSGYMVGEELFHCVRQYVDSSSVVFALYYHNFNEPPVAFHYRYTNGDHFLFCNYDMAGNLIGIWGD